MVGAMREMDDERHDLDKASPKPPVNANPRVILEVRRSRPGAAPTVFIPQDAVLRDGPNAVIIAIKGLP